LIGAIVGDIVGSVYEWNNIRASEYAIVYPFPHNKEEDKLYNPTPKG